MLLILTEQELCLIVQSVESVDWTYSGHGETAKSVIAKCRMAATKELSAREKRGEPEVA